MSRKANDPQFQELNELFRFVSLTVATKIYCPKCGASAELEEGLLALPHLCQGCGHEFVQRPSPGPANGWNVFGIVLMVIGVLGCQS